MSQVIGNAITAVLELERAEGAPRGVLTSVDGRCMPFAGWTELASAIETWREEASRPVPEGHMKKQKAPSGLEAP